MLAVRQGLRAKAIADATLVSLLGGDHFYHRRPQRPIVEMIASGTRALVTYNRVSAPRDPEIPRTDEDYDLHVWSKSGDTNDQIGERLIALFDKQPLPMTGRRLGEIHAFTAGDFYEEDTEIHHQVISVRVISYPA